MVRSSDAGVAHLSALPVPEPAQPRTSATVELPSKGKFYGDACPDGIVEIYPMTGRDEALVAGMDANEIVDIFDTLLKRCMKTPLDPDEMLSTDKFYLMLCLRANSYGSTYEFRVRCPQCGMFQQRSCEVPADFEIMPFTGTEVEPFEVKLSLSGKVVRFRLLRGKDDKDIVKYRNRELEKGKTVFGDPSYVYRMAKHIVEIDGTPVGNILEAMNFFENLVALDASELANAIEDRVSGINTEIDVTCTKCKAHFKTDMPFTAGFFRTQRRRVGVAS